MVSAVRKKIGRFGRLKHSVKNLKQFQNEEPPTPCIGRRIVDVGFFGKQFDAGCSCCGRHFKFSELKKETISGLSSNFHFKCRDCNTVSSIYTSDTETESTAEEGLEHIRRRPFTVNVKAALAMVHAGVGETHMNAILTTIGLPSTSFKTLKKHERKVGQVIEKTAQLSCQSACESEKKLEQEGHLTFDQALQWLDNDSRETADHHTDTSDQARSPAAEDREPVNVTVSQDASWSRRGRGWGHVIGLKTKRCLSFSTRKKSCHKCSHYSRLGKKVPNHDCRKNWQHSAKAMEGDIAVTLHREASQHGLRFEAVIGDEDSSSIKQIRDHVNSDIKKYSDLNHIKKTLTKKLEELHKTHRSLTEKVRISFLKNFTYVVHQNKEKSEEEMREALEAIVPHMFGEHRLCGEWCISKKTSVNKHQNLPFGKSLESPNLKSSLEDLIEPFITNPMKLMTTGNTQVNEALNNVAWSKAPKIRNYNKSESFDYRCAAAVCQFNDGCKYVEDVCNEGLMSPRKETTQFNLRKDRRRKYHKDYKSSRQCKRRRIELKKERKVRDTTSDVKLGITYKSDCLLDEALLDTTIIPDPISSQIKLEEDEARKVFIDIETTKLGRDAEVTQLSACCENAENFNRFILPNGPMAKAASDLTGIEIHAINSVRTLHHNGKPVVSVDIETALKDLLEWLGTLQGEKILIAHNGSRFDFPILMKDIVNHGLKEQALRVISGICDSLKVLKMSIPNQQSYKLETLYQALFHDTFDSHDSMNDTVALKDIFQFLKINHEVILQYSVKFAFSFESENNRNLLRQKMQILETQLSLNGKCIVSRGMLEKLCKSNIDYNVLRLAFDRNPESGVDLLLREKVGNSARVTNRQSIIQAIANFLAGNVCTE